MIYKVFAILKDRDKDSSLHLKEFFSVDNHIEAIDGLKKWIPLKLKLLKGYSVIFVELCVYDICRPDENGSIATGERDNIFIWPHYDDFQKTLTDSIEETVEKLTRQERNTLTP